MQNGQLERFDRLVQIGRQRDEILERTLRSGAGFERRRVGRGRFAVVVDRRGFFVAEVRAFVPRPGALAVELAGIANFGHGLGRAMRADEVDSIVKFLNVLTGEIPAKYIEKPALPPSTPETPKPVAE